MCNAEEYFLALDEPFLLPSSAIYRINDKLDDASDLSSIYSNEPELAVGDGHDADELFMDDAEFARRLYKFGLDTSGLPLRDDLLFKTFDKAANFTLKMEELSWWKKFKGIKAKPVQVPHVALWDYFGGTSCLDINCTAGDQIDVLCEEFQVREIDSVTTDGRTFLRLPMQWSLANKRLFSHPTWFLGISDLNTAYDYLLEDRSSYRPAAKGALNDLSMRLTSVLHSPVIEDQAQTDLQKNAVFINFQKDNSRNDASAENLSADVSALSGYQEVSKVLYKKPIKQEHKDRNKLNSEKEEINSEHIQHASLPFYIKTYTIRRSRIGRYLLFNRQFSTLYDLVYYYTNYQSPIPHKLNYGPTKKQQVIYFHNVPAPFTSPTRDIYAMTMKSEQWAARHFDQITEPTLLSQTFSFISRSVFDPSKNSHMEFAHSIQLTSDAIEGAQNYMKRSMSKENIESLKDTTADPAPNDDSILKTDIAIEIDISNLKYSPEDMLGSGAFGAVYRGKLETVEGEVISHPNVTKFYGFCYNETKEYAMLTFELVDIGSLADFMKEHEYNISANEHVDFLTQIARGMAHLHSLDPPIVHGDLAARNVLIHHHPKDETRYILKISDFGLSKTTRHEAHFFPDDPHKIPFKWLPPEVLHRRELSTKSDIWAYAILATEIYGVIDPYGMLPNEKVLPFLKDGHRMEKPSTMPYYIYNIILQCWRKQPVDRPTFNEIVRDLMPYYIEYESSHIIMLTSRIIAESIMNKKG
uniref:Bm6151, isoform c n=1 Tax=Brugia malayi TaxID=6279 RepID=A0A0J9XUG3_BRUMA|nr:Bm6151, isoform c [Brugia malayi]